MLDIFKTADANRPKYTALRKSMLDSLDAPGQAAATSFMHDVDAKGRLSINMRLGDLQTLLTGDVYRNVYESADRTAKHTGATVEQVLRQRLGTYHDRRIAFDSAVSNGRDLRYAALNIGGPGATTYGEYCVVFKSTVAPPTHTAFFPEDSVLRYVSSTAVVDITKLANEIAHDASKGTLSAHKHLADRDRFTHADWPKAYCCADIYVEATFMAGIKTSDIETIRIRKSDNKRLFDLAFGAVAGASKDYKSSVYTLLSAVLDRIEQLKLTLEVVDD